MPKLYPFDYLIWIPMFNLIIKYNFYFFLGEAEIKKKKCKDFSILWRGKPFQKTEKRRTSNRVF